MAIGLHELQFSITSDLSEVMDDWERLCRDKLHSMHQRPVWCIEWVQAFNNHLVFLRGGLNGQTHLLLPLELTHKFGCRILQVPGAAFSNMNTVLADHGISAPSTEAEVKAARKAIAKAIAPQFDALFLTNLPLVWREQQSVFSGLETTENQNCAYQLPLLSNFENTLSQINAKRRRKKFRISQREADLLGGYKYQIAESNAEKLLSFTTFLEQKAKRFATQGLPNVFANPQVIAFFQSQLLSEKETPPDTALELHSLVMTGKRDGEIASIAALTRKGDHCVCQFASIGDGELEVMSPGELLFYHVIERECSLGSALFDFGIGYQRYKTSWCPVTTPHHDVAIAGTFKGRVATAVITALTKAKRAAKQNAFIYKALQRMRRTKEDGQSS